MNLGPIYGEIKDLLIAINWEKFIIYTIALASISSAANCFKQKKWALGFWLSFLTLFCVSAAYLDWKEDLEQTRVGQFVSEKIGKAGHMVDKIEYEIYILGRKMRGHT